MKRENILEAVQLNKDLEILERSLSSIKSGDTSDCLSCGFTVQVSRAVIIDLGKERLDIIKIMLETYLEKQIKDKVQRINEL